MPCPKLVVGSDGCDKNLTGGVFSLQYCAFLFRLFGIPDSIASSRLLGVAGVFFSCLFVLFALSWNP